MSDRRIFKPRPSHGWIWPVLVGLLVVVSALLPLLSAEAAETPTGIWFLNTALVLLIGVPLVILAAWFPTMRYEIDDEALHLIYGPVLHYRIPLDEIRSIRERNLSVTLWSSMRFPGLALFSVPYSDVGTVRMCATAAARRILLVETEEAKYGLTPADVDGLVASVTARTEG